MDVGIVEIGNKAVSFTTDPVFMVPEYGWEKAAWFAIHIIASDSVTSGLKPTYLSIDLNLPMEITKQQLTIIWDTIHRGMCEDGNQRNYRTHRTVSRLPLSNGRWGNN